MSHVAVIITDMFEDSEYIEFVDLEVVENGNLISSRHPGNLPAVVDAYLKRLA